MKRFFDILSAGVALLVMLPVLLSLYLLIRIKLGSPVFFKQARPGIYGRPFKMVKFRTMTDTRDEAGKLLPDIERLTSFGKIIRATSLDELPELWNVLKGDMSLVGPRPLLCEYLELYTLEQARRHEVRPGITGWAQVNGRNMLSWDEKLRLDVWYVDNQSFFLDMKIIFLTIKKVIKREGISGSGHVTSEKFKGSDRS